MATKVYESVDIELLDGKRVTIKPLNIKLLREVMKAWSKVQDIKDEDAFLDICLACTQIAFKQFDPSLAANKETLEELLDIQTMYKILEIAADIKLNDPNLLAATQELVGQI